MGVRRGRPGWSRWCRTPGSCSLVLRSSKPLCREVLRTGQRRAGRSLGALPAPLACCVPGEPPARGERFGIAVVAGGENAGRGGAAVGWPVSAAERPEAHRDGRGGELRRPPPDHPAAHRLGADPVRRFTRGGLQQVPQLPVHPVHWVSRSISPASRGSSRNRATARASVALTVPTAQSKTCATCASDRSSKTRSTSTARCRAVSDRSARCTVTRTAASAARSPAAGLSGKVSDARSPHHHRRRHQLDQLLEHYVCAFQRLARIYLSHWHCVPVRDWLERTVVELREGNYPQYPRQLPLRGSDRALSRARWRA